MIDETNSSDDLDGDRTMQELLLMIDRQTGVLHPDLLVQSVTDEGIIELIVSKPAYPPLGFFVYDLSIVSFIKMFSACDATKPNVIKFFLQANRNFGYSS